MRPFVLSLYARKGGVGRTMLTQNLAGACAELGGSVLVIDTDSQASISKNFLGASAVEALRPYQTTACLFDDHVEPNPAELIHSTSIPNVSILPASDHLESLDRPVDIDDPSLTFSLRDFLQQGVADDYDAVLIDTPPNVSNLPAWSALMASDLVVSPVQTEKNSCESIIDVKRRLARAVSGGNPDLCDLGYFINMYKKRLSVHQVQRAQLQQLYGDQVFKTIIPDRTIYKEAALSRKPITHAHPRSAEAELIRALLQEILVRISDHIYRREQDVAPAKSNQSQRRRKHG